MGGSSTTFTSLLDSNSIANASNTPHSYSRCLCDLVALGFWNASNWQFMGVEAPKTAVCYGWAGGVLLFWGGHCLWGVGLLPRAMR